MRKLTGVIRNIPTDGDVVMLATTQDGQFDRDAVLIVPENLPGTAVSVDLLIAIGGEQYHVARLNFAIPEEGKGRTNIDFCIPDGEAVDYLFWSNGKMDVNFRNLSNQEGLLSLVFNP